MIIRLGGDEFMVIIEDCPKPQDIQKIAQKFLDICIPVLVDEGYQINVKDNRESTALDFITVTQETHKDKKWPKGHQEAGKSIILRDYQVGIINQFLSQPQCLQEIATGAGKTLITATLSQCVEQYGGTLVIVPNKDLVTQTHSSWETYHG